MEGKPLPGSRSCHLRAPQWPGSRTQAKGLACPHPNPSPVPWDSGLCFLLSQLLLPPPASSLPPYLGPDSSSFIFPLSCSRAKEAPPLHPLLPRPPGLGPKTSPSASHPIPVSPFTSRRFWGPETGNRGQAGVARRASGPSTGLSASDLLYDPRLHSEARWGTRPSVLQFQLCDFASCVASEFAVLLFFFFW